MIPVYEIERLTNHLLPIEIVDFLNTTSSYEIIIENIKETANNIAIDDISYYIEQRDLFDYDIIPISCIYDDFICLFYNKDKIQIIYWSSERALISRELGMFIMFDNIGDFFFNCKNRKTIT